MIWVMEINIHNATRTRKLVVNRLKRLDKFTLKVKTDECIRHHGDLVFCENINFIVIVCRFCFAFLELESHFMKK